MQVQLLSDLHLEHCQQGRRAGVEQFVPAVVGDVVVLAGDIGNGVQGMVEFAHVAVPVIYVCGNHELFGNHLNLMMGELRDCAKQFGFHFLDNSCTVVGGVRFVGATLWTDFELDSDLAGPSMNAARSDIADFSRIRTMNGFYRPEDSVNIHRVSRRWLAQVLAEPFDGKTVVVTHHAPSSRSVNARYAGDQLNPAFASELSELAGKADVWCHGHMHDSSDYDWQGTRVICNPRGYPLKGDGQSISEWENAAFDPAFTFEV